MESAKKKIRILVVEDNPHIRNLLHYLLRDTFDLELVDCIDDALLTAAQQHFDLFLLDINLGEQRTGIDLLKLLRQMPAYTATVSAKDLSSSMMSTLMVVIKISLSSPGR